MSYINPFSENFFGHKLIDLFKNLFNTLFIPNQENLQSKVNTLKAKFGFIDTINNIISNVFNIVNNTDSQASLSINIPDNRTGITNLTIIDLSWYAPYKQYGDMVITCLIYLFFIWRIYINLPNILGGVSSLSTDIISSSYKKEG